MEKIEYLDEERKKLWAKVLELSSEIENLKKTMPEHEREAKNASKQISTYKNRVIQAWNETEINKNKFVQLLQNSNKIDNAVNTVDTIDSLLSKSQGILEQTNIDQTKLNDRIQNLNEQSDNLNTLQEEANNVLANATSVESKLKGLLQNSAEKKQEIEDIYDEIEGYDTDEGTHIDGLKEKLQASFEKIETDNQNLKKDFESSKNNMFQWQQNFIKEKKSEFDSLLEKIKDLLPGAMSAGLSSAYAEKKKEEILELNNARKSFNKTIIWMSIVALLPIGYYLYLYYTGHSVEYIINHIPQITWVILPLYAPVIWLATCLNKRINLSKKLIEEYAYKEALNRTYEGLTGQIQNIKDKDNELRKEHLHIILKASSENPGKYITGYDKCDNPLLELMSKPEKISKLLKDTPLLTTLAEQIIRMNNENKILSKENKEE